MKKLLRIENLLWLVPVLLGAYVFFQYVLDPDVEFGLNPPALVLISLFVSVLGWAWQLMPGYIMHHFLRIIGRRNKIICILHVVLSLILHLPLDDYASSVVPGWHTTIYPPLFNFGFASYLSWFDLLYWCVQIAFIVYGLVMIRRWRKTATS
jgi:hypothetical protein